MQDVSQLESSPLSPIDKFPWSTSAAFQTAAGLDGNWFNAKGGFNASDPAISQGVRKLTWEEFCDALLADLNWMLKTYKLNSLEQVAIIDIARVYSTIFERGAPLNAQDPDLSPQPGTPLSEIGISGDDLASGMGWLTQMVEEEGNRLMRLLPFINLQIESELAAYPQKPVLIFTPTFLRENSPLTKALPLMAKQAGVKAIVYMREEHDVYGGFVDAEAIK